MRTTRIAVCLVVWPLVAVLFAAQAYAADADGQKMFSRERLDRLLAPLVRCPDSLLGNILEAATYPLEVSQAARLMQANRGLSGSSLASALDEMAWDPSVKSLVNSPSILRRMSERMDWTQELGDACLVQKDDVMERMAALRHETENPKANGRPVIADGSPGQVSYYYAPSRQYGTIVAVPLPVPRASLPAGQGSVVERVQIATNPDRSRTGSPGYGRAAFYPSQGARPVAGPGQVAYAARVSYQGGFFNARTGRALGQVSGPRGASWANRRGSWRVARAARINR